MFLVLLLTACGAITAPAAQDPFLLLSPPSLVSNKIQFTITGEAEVGYVVEASADSVTWTAVATNVDTNITRVVNLDPSTNAVFYRAWRKDLPVFAGALVAKEGIDFMGNGVHVDSFDSGDSRYNTYGVYDPTKRKDGGGVASINGGINAGNAGINGKLRTGIRGDFAFGATGYAGPLDWLGPGIYSPEYFRKDFRFVLPDVGPPYTNGLPPIAGCRHEQLDTRER
jgi:hypothetical protein